MSRQELDDDELIELMLDEPRLVRRPLIVVDGALLPPRSGVDRIIAAIEERVRP